ncbi:hypothetical protein [Paraburkholderia tropica]|uniref:hypothetical protein n=1 Tax=Paraburkholderia tropica TaxID=92647 RepID=UPI000AEFFCC9|nr:hypothetical protein [Paraburkholderia tropica]
MFFRLQIELFEPAGYGHAIRLLSGFADAGSLSCARQGVPGMDVSLVCVSAATAYALAHMLVQTGVARTAMLQRLDA